jgi:L-threonylcarbamoyladenylate synthase
MQGGLVAFPTETVYGLGADASNIEAVKSIYDAKGRPSNHPVIVHIARADQIHQWCTAIPDQAWMLAKAFWPGPLTLILKRHPNVSSRVSGGQDTIGVRSPSHPVALAMLDRFAQLKQASGESLVGVAAPSANRFGRVSPTCAAHVRSEFPSLVANGMPILEGGASEVGIESTIVDLSSLPDGRAVLLRPGMIDMQAIEAVLGAQLERPDEHSPRVSGSLRAHYAPQTPLQLVKIDQLADSAHQWLQTYPGRLALMTRSQTQQHGGPHADRTVQVVMPDDPADYARELYAQLRSIDYLKVERVMCEILPAQSQWTGVRDRLARAAAAHDSESDRLG